MGRQHRQHINGGFYHVMVSGNNGRDIFFEPAEYRFFFGLLEEGLAKFDHKIHAFCFMRNHVHLAIETGEISLAKPMHNLNMRFARRFNSRNNLLGHCFQGRYQAKIVKDDNQLRALIRYIHLNPVRANIATDPLQFRWSSHRSYLGVNPLALVTTEFVLSLFGNTKKSALQAYQTFVNDLINYNDPRLLAMTFSLPNNQLNYLTDFCCMRYGIVKKRLFHKMQGAHIDKVRSLIVWLALDIHDYRMSEVARYFNRSITGLRAQITKLKTVLKNEAQRLKVVYLNHANNHQ